LIRLGFSLAQGRQFFRTLLRLPHLSRKWQQVQGRQWTLSTDGFIEHAVSRSSITGQLYRVQCGDAAPQVGQARLMARLRRIGPSARAGRAGLTGQRGGPPLGSRMGLVYD
jgi:hypothetical protein